MTKAIVIGAGIAGPVAAMALRRAGIDATIYEGHEPATQDVGSYLTLASNGLDALRAIDADAPVITAGFPTPATALFSGTGKLLATIPIGKTSPEGTVSRTIKRADLHRALLDLAAGRGVPVDFGRRLVTAETTPAGVVAAFEDGSRASGDLLIGCDGVHSVTRQIIDPSAPAPRYVGLMNFAGYTRRAGAAGETGTWHMIFGKHAFFGYVPDHVGGTVWFANVPRRPSSQPEREGTRAEHWRHWLIDLFADDRGPAAELIAAGELQLAADDTYDLPSIPVWHRERMIVIGDAAHAPSPTSGQGASMAMEDGVVLAKCLRDIGDVSQAFATFERLRRRRVERIVAQGAKGSSNKTLGPLGRRFRDLLLPVVFRYVVTERSLAWMYDHHTDWHQSVQLDEARQRS